MKNKFIIGNLSIGDIVIPIVESDIRFPDTMGAIRVRWGINRDNFRVAPGLYAIGNPDSGSNVFVTANYKLSFDAVRKNLAGENGWILVLDTRGVNVWCAAGKGTFGTKELVNRIRVSSLEKIVNHRRLILPQLGAVGVAAHKVKEETGFNVSYGPVRASDIKKFMNDGFRADKAMRTVTFGFTDRIKLIPNDFMYGKYYLLGALVIVFLISGISSKGISLGDFYGEGGSSLLRIFLAYFSGIVLTPLFLPYIPGRRFSVKGFYAGLTVFLIFLLLGSAGGNIFEISAWFLTITAISSFLAMNFTGSSTYTSLSGVKKEMKTSLPVQIGFAFTGLVLLVAGKLI